MHTSSFSSLAFKSNHRPSEAGLRKTVMADSSPCLWLGLHLPTFLDENGTMLHRPDAPKRPDVWHGDLVCEWLTKLLRFSSRPFVSVQRQPLSPDLEENLTLVWGPEVKTKRKVWILSSFFHAQIKANWDFLEIRGPKMFHSTPSILLL